MDRREIDVPASRILRQISETLGLPLETFYHDAPGEAGELLTLMRLWSSIEDGQARKRILMVARSEFERASVNRSP